MPRARDPFPTTAWSELQALQARGEQGAEQALLHLYRCYWGPLYAYLRRRGESDEDACDLLQSFYLHLLVRDVASRIGPDGGRLRAYLLTALRNFSSHRTQHEAALKRAPPEAILSLDRLRDERRFEPSDRTASPEAAFQQRWAVSLAARAARELATREERAGRAGFFEALRGHVLGGGERLPYSELAERLGLTTGAVKVRVHRYRRRLGAILRQEVARTVADATAIDDELRHLIRCL